MTLNTCLAKRRFGRSLATVLKLASLALVAFTSGQPAAAADFKSPDILILGDSQLTFGAGPEFLSFFQNIEANCKPNKKKEKALSKIDSQSVAVIGVRSTSLHSWTARSGAAKGSVCDIDKKWKVNAGSFGTVNSSKNIYIQIGQGVPYQFCKKNTAPFEAMFNNKYYDPKLLVMSFLGNSTDRWANNPKAALKDVQATMKQLPKGMPCIFLTTAPPYTQKAVDQRVRAQENVKAAFKKSGSRCSFVSGLSKRTIGANLGNKKHFRLNKSGGVKDPYHPNKKAAQAFFSLERKTLCKAILEQI